jgi:hypothetical protein
VRRVGATVKAGKVVIELSHGDLQAQVE